MVVVAKPPAAPVRHDEAAVDEGNDPCGKVEHGLGAGAVAEPRLAASRERDDLPRRVERRGGVQGTRARTDRRACVCVRERTNKGRGHASAAAAAQAGSRPAKGAALAANSRCRADGQTIGARQTARERGKVAVPGWRR